ncbi:MAG: acyl carrier protein [Oscillospiraceae bacterium]|jgi:acyl carrier protein|nr:acyl carrier protein [Oscillospiraceae bacterium]
MTAVEIIETVTRAVAVRTGRDASEITPETDVREDLGMDSLDAVELIMELEDEFNVAIPSEKSADLKTVGEIAALVGSLLGIAQ